MFYLREDNRFAQGHLGSRERRDLRENQVVSRNDQLV